MIVSFLRNTSVKLLYNIKVHFKSVMIKRPPVNIIQVRTRTKFVDKWEVPVYMFNGPVYPPILSGSGYVLSRSAAECIYKEAIYIPYFHLEVIIIY